MSFSPTTNQGEGTVDTTPKTRTSFGGSVEHRNDAESDSNEEGGSNSSTGDESTVNSKKKRKKKKRNEHKRQLTYLASERASEQ